MHPKRTDNFAGTKPLNIEDMKKLSSLALVFALTTLFSTTAFAVPVEIILHASTDHKHAEKGYDRRSISLAPSAQQDGNLIRIYTHDPNENITIMVTDAEGFVVYEADAVGGHSFTLDAQERGEFTLTLDIDKGKYEGTFHLE